MSAFLLSQVLVGLAAVFDFGSMQFAKRHFIHIGQAFAAALISAHFFILDVNTAGVIFAVGSVRCLLTLKWRGPLMRFIFLAFIVLATICTWDGFPSVLSCTAGLLLAAGVFEASQQRLRHFFIAGSSTWLVHNILVWTPVGILLEILFLSSNLIGYYRFVWRPANSD